LIAAGLVLAFLVSPAVVLGAGSNTVAYTENFEGEPAGTALTNMTGWSSSGDAVAVVTNNGDYNFTETSYPIPGAHTKAVDFNAGTGGITNSFVPEAGTGMLYLDTMLKIITGDQDPGIFTNDPSIRVGVYADAGSNYWLYNYDDVGLTNRFSAITNMTAQDGTWARVTVTLDSQSDPFFVPLFELQINGVPALSADGYANPDTTGSKPGSWHLFADNAFPGYVSSVELRGTGMLDDMVLTTNKPAFEVIITASTEPDDISICSIVPSGDIAFQPGDTTNFLITASNYYHIVDIETNGVSIGAIPDGLTTTNFTWSNIQKGDSSIEAIFAADKSNGVPHWWLAQFGWTSNWEFHSTNDHNMNGQPTYVDYYTSVHPTNAGSEFVVVDMGVQNGTSYIVVVAENVDPDLDPFGVEKSTNLMQGASGWFTPDPPTFGRLEGSNWWWESTPASVDVPGYYRATAATNGL